MRPKFLRLRKLLIGSLAALIVLDLGLFVYSMRLSSDTRIPQSELRERAKQLQLLKADVSRAMEIEKSTPTTKEDCERFEKALPPLSGGYSTISSELEEVSQKAGLQIGSLSFHPKEDAERGVTEITIDASVNGSYKSVVDFLDGLQRSKNRYVVDDLSLAVDSGQNKAGELRVNLHVRSYFRAVA